MSTAIKTLVTITVYHYVGDICQGSTTLSEFCKDGERPQDTANRRVRELEDLDFSVFGSCENKLYNFTSESLGYCLETGNTWSV